MAEKKEPKKNTPLPVETQKQRWVKYGANVALTTVIVIVLAGFMVYIAQRHNLRKDTTTGGAYSLKPQTVKILDGLTQKIKIVGLYSRTKQAQEKVVQEDDGPEARYAEVADLLREYQQKSNGRITIEMIDPDNENARVEKLFNEVIQKYSNDVKMYKDVLDSYPKTVDEITKLAKEDLESVGKLPDFEDRKLQIAQAEIIGTLAFFPQWMEKLKFSVKEQIELKVPDYKGATDRIKARVEEMSESCGALLKRYAALEADPKTPKELTAFTATSKPRIESIKKLSDDLLAKTENLKSIKQLDELRQNKKNSIIVMGEQDMKVLPFDSVYKNDTMRSVDADGKSKPRFAGEQQISTAIVRLTNKEKKKVAFIRASGPPVTLSLRMVGYEGMLTAMGERLREYDIEIIEKDLSGQWMQQAMQLQMQGMPIPMEPRDEELKDAIWIVMNPPVNQRMPTASPLGMRLADHLKSGGSAMVLMGPQSDNLGPALADWGIKTRPDAVIVHDKIDSTGARSDDPALDWQRQPFVFILNKYGDHLITRPLQSLDSLFAPLVPVITAATKGVKVTNILPIPTQPNSWGETDFEKVRNREPLEFTGKKDDKEVDVPGPLFGGVIAEKDGAGRLVIIGSMDFPGNDMLTIPDVVVRKNTGKNVPRFPANPELFINSVYWLAKMDTMIAISPASLEVPRIAPMTDGVQKTWLTVLIGIMPAMVVLCGAVVWFRRRD